MNAVNLIPADARKRRINAGTSRPTMALVAGLAVILVAVIVYVTAMNKVSSRQRELAQVTTAAQQWRAVASSYQQYVHTAQQRAQELTAVRQLATGRYPWEAMLGQLSSLMPADAALVSLQATTSSGTSVPASGAASTTSTPATGASTASSSTPVPAVQLSGCAASQPAVAQTMVALRRIQDVSAVTLSSSTDSGSSGGGSGSSGGSSAGGGGCPFSVQFQLSLTFTAPPAAAVAASAAATTGSGSTATTRNSSGGTTAAVTAINSTGAAQ